MTGNDRLAMRYLERTTEALEAIAKSLGRLQVDVEAITQRRILAETGTNDLVAELQRRTPPGSYTAPDDWTPFNPPKVKP